MQDLTVATDNVEAGRRLGEYARTIVGKDDKIAVISHVKGVSTAVEREQGFREGLGDYEKNIVLWRFKYVGTPSDAGWDSYKI